MVRKLHRTLCVLIVAAALAVPFGVAASDVTLQNAPARVFFSPEGKQAQAVVNEIDNATMEILVESYSFDSPRIAKALQDAAKRAVNIEVMVDRNRRPDRSGVLLSLMGARIPVLIDDAHPANLNEVIIIDKTTVITGAFSLSATGGKNGGNMLVLKSKDLAGLYLDNWLAHKGHSRVFQGKGPLKVTGKKKRKS